MQKDLFDQPWLCEFIGKKFGFFSPNVWTTLSLIVAFVAFLLVAFGYFWAGVILFMISALMDFIDGKVARYSERVSSLGAWWDGVVDRFVDALFIGCFFFFDFPGSERQLSIMLFVLLFATLLPPFIVAYANHRGVVPDSSERVIWRFAFRFEYLVLLGTSGVLQRVNIMASYVFLWITVGLMAATVIQSMVVVVVKSKDYE